MKDRRRLGLLVPSSDVVMEDDLWRRLPPAFTLHVARMYLETGRLAESVEKFEGALLRHSRSRALDAIAAVKAHYYLGLAYERSGWTDRAIEQYEMFLDIWKDADEGIEEIEDARKRLSALKIES